jgi:CspA family cold shock protein
LGALLTPHFCFFSIVRNRILAVPAAASLTSPFRIINQNPGCGAACSDAGHVESICFHELRRTTMSKGTVKWFNPTKGYGFIQPSDGQKDVFVHISAVERAGLSNLNEGQTVEYELVTGRNGKASAENLKVS